MARCRQLVPNLERDLSTGSGDTPPLAFRGSAPNSMVNVVGQGIFEAGLLRDAIPADLACNVDSDAVAWKKGLRRQFPALALRHPVRIHYFT